MIKLNYSATQKTTGRDISYVDTDIAAVRAIAQAAVDVELFTIPLYMSAMYSLECKHQITSGGNNFYQGRLWPGGSPKNGAGWGDRSKNNVAFNKIFSIFIQEMLHLQLAANIATAISEGVSVYSTFPDFTSKAMHTNPETGLYDATAWYCYNNSTFIPHILDLMDTKSYTNVKVKLGSIIENIELFLCIEQSVEKAQYELDHSPKPYFPAVPFDNWQADDDLPLFGSIGYMYECLKAYLKISYTDGTTLWDKVFNANAWQNDLFNSFSVGGHPMREFMGFETTIATTWSEQAMKQVFDAMSAITDQGEGSTLSLEAHNSDGTVERTLLGRKAQMTVGDVHSAYQASKPALDADYPSFNDKGEQIASADADVRFHNGQKDHYALFEEIKHMVHRKELTCWSGKRQWTGTDLKTDDYVPGPLDKVLGPDATAAAMNTLIADGAKAPNGDDYYTYLSKASAGSIYGVTSVLNNYWDAPTQRSSSVPFPFPSMGGTGDRMGIVWALFGAPPDLSLGCPQPAGDQLYHACQGLSFAPDGGNYGVNACADVAVFHTCKGSNQCRAQGGCGFVHTATGGGNCSSHAAAPKQGASRTSTALETRTVGLQPENVGRYSCKQPTYSAPSDNQCGSLGGCAVPISAHQQYPTSGQMEFFYFTKDGDTWSSTLVDGDKMKFGPATDNNYVHDVAYKAFKVAVSKMDSGAKVPDEPPAPSALRVALMPST